MPSGPNDVVHYDAVRRALQNGNAAVMVGAGFSRNAVNGNELAMWQDVARELWRQLNPDATDLADFSASTVTQLGEQYARVFSKPALEELLKRLIPDEQVAPGLLHKSLLSLQWSEIFTTNYDTLLERAAESIVDRAHYTVMCREDIPQSKILGRRRIVKLHGSFPSQRPFIFTEEDYRKYPDISAPFINLVRQSMLENVFCLIGFSGEDPNFLHWIGWVRDMLDEHALPIYLFESRPPSLGTQKLLESRRVTSVTLPTKPGIEDWDYAARYAALFDILKKPLENKVEDWGQRPSELTVLLNNPSDTITQFEQVVGVFDTIRTLRSNYPGWFVAPYTIRRRFQNSVRDTHNLLQKPLIQECFLTNAPHVGIAILAEYSWHQDVTLQCMDDMLAGLALRLLEQTDPKSCNVTAYEKDALKHLGAHTPYVFQQRWKELALGVLRWAREAIRETEYATIRKSVNQHFSTDLQTADQIAYEDILLKLYTGERDIAQHLLKAWDVRSPDGYMLVRKGMLLGELSEVSSGLKIALEGLKRLRKNQRSRLNSALYLSQEAWACLAIGYLQKSPVLPFNDNSPQEEPDFLPELVTQRLRDLAVAGHDVQNEILQLTADLNAETPEPSQSISYAQLFDLGRYSTTQHLSGNYSYHNKIRAAFSWLSLTDRVALVPRVGNATFDIGSFGQAAWWVQYADSMRRVLSVMVRLLNSKMLAPRNSTQLIHSAGWLSRYQVARTPEVLAQEIFERSISFALRMFDKKFESDLMERAICFHMQVSSRLIIRISTPGFAALQLEKIIQLYKSVSMASRATLWEEAGNLIARCFEALTPLERLNSVPALASIPDRLEAGISDRLERNEWFDITALHRREGDLLIRKVPKGLEAIVNMLIDRLSVENAGPDSQPYSALPADASSWSRLFWIKSWGGVSNNQIAKVEGILLSQEGWPSIPGHYHWAVFLWITHTRKKSAKRRFKQWFTKQSLENFSTTALHSEQEAAAGRSWQIRDADAFLKNFIGSLELAGWSEDEMAAAMLPVKRWWDEEWQYIEPELSKIGSLRNMLLKRMTDIDSILAAFIDKFSISTISSHPMLVAWVEEMQLGLERIGSSLLCVDLARAISEGNQNRLLDLEAKFLPRLYSDDVASLQETKKVITYWAQHPRSKDYAPPRSLIYSLAGIISARRMPALSWALQAMTEISKTRPEWITADCYTMLDVGLGGMLSELTYAEHLIGTGIPDDSTPILRFNCVLLARILRTTSYYETNDACGHWLMQAGCDPLPELRFIPI